MFFIKAIKTKKSITIRTESFYFFLLSHYLLLLILVAGFFHSNQHNAFKHRGHILLFLLACDRRVNVLLGQFFSVSHPASASRTAYQVVKIEQDFHETAKWLFCLQRSVPCISNSYLLVPFRKPIQMLPFGTILSTVWDMCNRLTAYQINQHLVFLRCNLVLLVASWYVHFRYWYFQYSPQLLKRARQIK